VQRGGAKSRPFKTTAGQNPPLHALGVPTLAKGARVGQPRSWRPWRLKIKVKCSGQECPSTRSISRNTKQQVPPLRHRWRSGSGRNDKPVVALRDDGAAEAASFQGRAIRTRSVVV